MFTSFSSDKADAQGDENAAPRDNEEPLAEPKSHAALGKSKSWSASGSGASKLGVQKRGAPGGGLAAGAGKKQRKSDFLSVLSSYQCVTQTTSSSSSQPM